jgi:predicted NBD/HSP70 family sugar kinase
MADTGLNHQAVKAGNKNLVLRKLLEDGPLSRTDLAKASRLSKMTITNHIQELLLSGDIRVIPDAERVPLTGHDAAPEADAKIRSGRRPALLETVPDARHAVSLYVSRDRLEASVFNWKLQEKATHAEPFPNKDTAEQFHARLLRCIDAVISQSDMPVASLSGIGVAMIGPLDYQNGVLLNPPNFHELTEIPIRNWLAEAYGVPVYVENDMNAAAVAELLFGKGKGLRSFLYVGVTNGIGAGIVQDGRLFRGFAGYAGELGHTTVSGEGPVCSCGNTGCLELYASIPAMVAAVNKNLPNQQKRDLVNKQDRNDQQSSKKERNTNTGNPLSWQEIAAAEQHGISSVHESLSACFRYLGTGLVTAVNLFDPQAIFLGHDVALAGERILSDLVPDVHRRVLAKQHQQIPISLSAFGHRAALHGGAALVFDAILNSPAT